MMHTTTISGFEPPDRRESVAALVRIVLLQAAVGVVTAISVWVAAGDAAGFSALLGALICVIPSVLFALWVAAGMFLAGARRQLHGFYAGEVFKLAVTVALFAVVFSTVDGLAPLYLFIGFIVTQLSMLWVLARG